jgi:hypothetical protein
MTKAKNGTGPAFTGLDPEGLVPIVVLPGTATLPLSETPEIVAERYDLSLKVKRLERRLAEIDACLKKKTGERQVGDFWVNVASSNQERMDQEAVRELLGEAVPMKLVPVVRLTVVPA